MYFIKPAIVILAIALTGCATGIKQKDMASSIQTLQADKGRIYFFRSASILGAAIQPSIMLDGTKVGDSKPGGFFFVDGTVGAHEVTTATEVEKKLTFTLDKGEVKYIKTSISLGILVGRIIPELVSPTDAQKELPDLSYTGTMPSARTELSSTMAPAANNNTMDKVPFVSPQCQSHFEIFKTKANPRAFAISKDGHCGYAYSFSSRKGPSDPKERAIFNCKKNTSLDCVLYFVDDSIVFDKQLYGTPATPAVSAQATSISQLQDGQIGQYSHQTELLAKDQSCSTAPHAVLNAKGKGFESYTVSCDNGDALTMRCDLGQCRVLK